MMPIIGPAKRHGLTLGPVTGRMIAEMMTGSEVIVDPMPFRVDRF
jgi:D-amino-acid dehydrogenase